VEWVILALIIVFVIFSWLMIQGTRAALAYRRQAAAGEVAVIREIAEEAIFGWRSQRRPKEVPPEVWRGIQSLEMVDVGPDYVRVIVRADSEYKLVDGRWREVASPLQAGMVITAKAADMLLYELPHCKLDKVQIDVYTAFREAAGNASRQCILSTIASRQRARAVEWDRWTAQEIVDALAGRYRLNEVGQPLPIDPDEVTVSPPPVTPGAGGDGHQVKTPL
jgi:hypothetical protein